ncbi:hypothetical protein [Spongiactinospora sp. TRM90649]|uniref:hypothetical protein n=1 Tax=Spongiactinospora sp. TRM90649 TaxID=3031114 RepID=UPI0023F90638|nr:hypothetical protein [Spongiactinospora sp. TRM90649]MDF5756430.1 hypothetical protein [Spongiactinospora sp. TRM90649]
MPFAETPLTDPMRRAIRHAWGRPLDDEPVRLYGGEESAAYRVEVASAALEWTDENGEGPAQRRRFIADYHEAGGTAGDMDEETVVQLIRHRLRREAAYFDHARRQGAEHDEDDIEYHLRRVKAFFDLSP